MPHSNDLLAIGRPLAERIRGVLAELEWTVNRRIATGVSVALLGLAHSGRLCYVADMKIHRGAILVLALALLLLLPTISVAQGGPVAVPGTADVDVGAPLVPGGEPEPAWHRAWRAERDRGPNFTDLMKLDPSIVSSAIHIDPQTLEPTWIIGTRADPCGPKKIASPALQAKVREFMARYTDAPVTFETGPTMIATSNVTIVCK